jgi:hypothetical protein
MLEKAEMSPLKWTAFRVQAGCFKMIMNQKRASYKLLNYCQTDTPSGRPTEVEEQLKWDKLEARISKQS